MSSSSADDGKQLDLIDETDDEKLAAKYHGLQLAHLQKCLHKRQKFFDSGDYQMAKQQQQQQNVKGLKDSKAIDITTGDIIPTPEMVRARKASNPEKGNKFS